MSAAPLLLVCLLAPPAVPGENAPLTGLALERRAAAELEAALDAPPAEAVDIRPETSLPDALSILLPDQTVLPDTPRLDLEGVDLRDLSLADGLRLPAGRFPVRTAVEEALILVNDVPLTYLNDGGVLRITTQDYADETLVTRVYPVRDLLAAAGAAYHWDPVPTRIESAQGPTGGQFGPLPVVNRVDEGSALAAGTNGNASTLDAAVSAEQPLIHLIQTVTGGIDQGGGWEEIDGEGGAMSFFNGVLTVRQTQAVHRQIETLLADLRAAFTEQPWTVLSDLRLAEPATADPTETETGTAAEPAE
ncbi:hypothetical protein [Alienimonas sp. DA493]|uniref:hypothetical protein n=1 Tax=Alienimonas sp. DA493 TaxID=3373605 RepID=UPI0037544702